MITAEELGISQSDWNALHKQNTDIAFEISVYEPINWLEAIAPSGSNPFAHIIGTPPDDLRIFDAVGSSWSPGSGMIYVKDHYDVRLSQTAKLLDATAFYAEGDAFFDPEPAIRPRMVQTLDSPSTKCSYYIWGRQSGAGDYRLWRFDIAGVLAGAGSLIFEGSALVWTTTIAPNFVIDELPSPVFVSTTLENQEYPASNIVNGFSNPDNSFIVPFPNVQNTAEIVLDLNPLRGIEPNAVILRYGSNDPTIIERIIPTAFAESSSPTGPWTPLTTSSATSHPNGSVSLRWLPGNEPGERYIRMTIGSLAFTAQGDPAPSIGDIVFGVFSQAQIYTHPTLNTDNSQTVYHLIPDNADADDISDGWWQLYVDDTATGYYFPGPMLDVEMYRSNKRGKLYLVLYTNLPGHIGQAFDTYLDTAYATQENNQGIILYEISVNTLTGEIGQIAGPFDIERIAQISPGMDRYPVNMFETSDRLVIMSKRFSGNTVARGGFVATQYLHSPDGQHWTAPRLILSSKVASAAEPDAILEPSSIRPLSKMIFRDHSDGDTSYIQWVDSGGEQRVEVGDEWGMLPMDISDIGEYLTSLSINKVNLASGRLEFDFSEAVEGQVPGYLRSIFSAPRAIIKLGYRNPVTDEYVLMPWAKLYIDATTVDVNASTSSDGGSTLSRSLSMVGKDRMTYLTERIRSIDGVFNLSQLQFASSFSNQLSFGEVVPRHWATLTGEWVAKLQPFAFPEGLFFGKWTEINNEKIIATATYDSDISDFDCSVGIARNTALTVDASPSLCGIVCHYMDEDNFTALLTGPPQGNLGESNQQFRLVRFHDGKQTILFSDEVAGSFPINYIRLVHKNGQFTAYLSSGRDVWDNTIQSSETVHINTYRDDMVPLARNAPKVRAEEGRGMRGQLGVMVLTRRANQGQPGVTTGLIGGFHNFQFSDFYPPRTMQDAILALSVYGTIVNVDIDSRFVPGRVAHTWHEGFGALGAWRDSQFADDNADESVTVDITAPGNNGQKVFFARNDSTSDVTKDETITPTQTFECTVDVDYNGLTEAGQKRFGIGLGQHTLPHLLAPSSLQYGWSEDGYEVEFDFENEVVRFIRQTDGVDESTDILADFPITANTNDLYDLRVVSKEVQFSSEATDKYLLLSAYIDKALVGYHGIQLGTADIRENRWNWGFTARVGSSIRISNFMLHDLSETIDVVTIDPGETPHSALRRVISGKHLRMFLRFNETLRVINPINQRIISDGFEYFEPEGYKRQYNMGQRATHIRVNGAYVFAEIIDDALDDIEHRFEQVDNPYIITEADAIAEARRVSKGYEEIGDIVEIEGSLKPLVENEDVVILTQEDHNIDLEPEQNGVYFVNDVRLTFGPGQFLTSYTLRGNPNTNGQ